MLRCVDPGFSDAEDPNTLITASFFFLHYQAQNKQRNWPWQRREADLHSQKNEKVPGQIYKREKKVLAKKATGKKKQELRCQKRKPRLENSLKNKLKTQKISESSQQSEKSTSLELLRLFVFLKKWLKNASWLSLPGFHLHNFVQWKKKSGFTL